MIESIVIFRFILPDLPPFGEDFGTTFILTKTRAFVETFRTKIHTNFIFYFQIFCVFLFRIPALSGKKAPFASLFRILTDKWGRIASLELENYSSASRFTPKRLRDSASRSFLNWVV